MDRAVERRRQLGDDGACARSTASPGCAAEQVVRGEIGEHACDEGRAPPVAAASICVPERDLMAGAGES